MTVMIDHSAQTGGSTACQALCRAPGLSENDDRNSEVVISRYCGIVSSPRLEADAAAAAIVC